MLRSIGRRRLVLSPFTHSLLVCRLLHPLLTSQVSPQGVGTPPSLAAGSACEVLHELHLLPGIASLDVACCLHLTSTHALLHVAHIEQ